MAPSTSTPTNLHRAPVACLQCREAKVRCLVSLRLGHCDRCRTNGSECIFAQSKRAKVRAQPYAQRTKQGQETTGNYNQYSMDRTTASQRQSQPLHSVCDDAIVPTYRPPHSPSLRVKSTDNIQQPSLQHRQPVITNATRARIIAALATIKGRRGSPFTFVTSGDSPSFSARGNSNDHTPVNGLQQHSIEQCQKASPALKLSRLLRPLKTSVHAENNDDDWRPAGSVKMPSYISSMTLGQTIVDPIKGGMISLQASRALFEFFMIQMNAKWEYILDPHVDTHDSVQMRNSLLFASILFCASKFAHFTGGNIVATPDPFLQSRLCSLARNLAIMAMAEGNRSIETLQAFYLLVCWKDADDDVSYLHSGYAFHILHDLDLDLKQGDSDGLQVARRKRTWLALFRQDRQQSLFFMRRASLNQGDEDTRLLGDINVWLKMPHALPSDLTACCSADLRCVQSKLRHLVRRGSPEMLPCLLELMDADLKLWRSKWHHHMGGDGRDPDNTSTSNPGLLFPGRSHLTTLVNVWENGVRLNVASAILRQALMASVSSMDPNNQSASSPVDIDLSTQEVLSQNLPGLTSSVEGAFGTLRHLMNFPPSDLRLAPDAILLLAPNAALFLCLLLCLPGNDILGQAFQKTAVGLIRDIAQHIGQAIQSPQDTVALIFAYLESLVDILDSSKSQDSTEQHGLGLQSSDVINSTVNTVGISYEDPPSQASVLGDEIGTQTYNGAQNEAMLSTAGDFNQNLHMQSLANLLDGYLFWEMPSADGDINLGS